jgi:hypothetical protein
VQKFCNMSVECKIKPDSNIDLLVVQGWNSNLDVSVVHGLILWIKNCAI